MANDIGETVHSPRENHVSQADSVYTMETPHGEITFTGPVINGAGPRHEGIDNLDEIGRSESGAIVLKTATVEPWPGNPKKRWSPPEEFHGGALNAMGLPNLGHEAYAEEVARLRETYGKPVIASVSGKKRGDNAKMIRYYTEKGVDAVEINASCPNTQREGPMLGYDSGASGALSVELAECREATDKPIILKLPPFSDPYFAEKVVPACLDNHIDGINAVNTLGMSCKVNLETFETAISAMEGYGGLSGEPLRPLAVGNVRKYFELFGPDYLIIGTGGISRGEHALEHVVAGADLVSLATAPMKEGPGAFGRVCAELQERLDHKALEEVRGKLRVRPEEAEGA